MAFLVFRLTIVLFCTSSLYDSSNNLMVTVTKAPTKDWGIDVSTSFKVYLFVAYYN